MAPGPLFIIGGALRIDNDALWARMVREAGGAGARIAVFPTASNRPEYAANQVIDCLGSHGAAPFMVPLAQRLPGCELAAVANDAEWSARIAAADGAYFTGGDQARITEALRNTAMLDALWAMFRRGGMLAGSSAGAAMMSRTMFYDVDTTLSTLKQGVQDGRELADGLGFVGPDLFIDQHALVRGRFARMLPAMLAKGYRYGIGVDENTAVLMRDGRLQVLGYKGAVLVDCSAAQRAVAAPGLAVSNVLLSYLDSGDAVDLESGALLPAADKKAGKMDVEANPDRQPKLYSDILGNTVLIDMMVDLVCSSRAQAMGLAFDPNADQPELGFEFRLSKTPATDAYFSKDSGAEAYSVYGLRLDVQPVRMALPLYAAWEE
jgi:cyanophycinase